MKIIYYLGKLNMGGAERSTVRLLNAFVEKGHDVTLFVKSGGGKLETELSPQVKIIYLYKVDGLLDNNPDRTLKGMLNVPVRNIIKCVIQSIRGKIMSSYLIIRKPSFDLAITGWHGYDPRILYRMTKSKVRLQIIRSEGGIAPVRNSELGNKEFKYLDNLKYVDGYVCISEDLKEKFINNCHISKDKIFTIYNTINTVGYDDAYEIPLEYKNSDKYSVRILTVCRLSEAAKGLKRMVSICRKLKDLKYPFKWYVVGDGPDAQMLKDMIVREDISDVMILCGWKQNPFPYYQHADLVAVLSHFEGLCGAVNEAKLMKRPLIATRFASIEEQISHGENGFIVDNNTESILLGMKTLLTDEELRLSLAINGMPETLLNNDVKLRQYEEVYEKLAKVKVE